MMRVVAFCLLVLLTACGVPQPAVYDGGKGRLRRLRAVAPGVGALRPEHPAAGMAFEFGGHAEAVLPRGRF